MELKIYNPQEGGYFKEERKEFRGVEGRDYSQRYPGYPATVYTDETIRSKPRPTGSR